MMFVNIEPYEVMYFRTAKPFTAGDDHYIETIFPPYPSTIYGAFRTYILENNNIAFHEYKDLKKEIMNNDDLYRYVGVPEELGSMCFKGVFIRKNNKFLFKAPVDLLFKEKDSKNEQKFFILKPKKLFNADTSSGFDFLPFIKDIEYAPLTKYYLSIENLNNYLTLSPISIEGLTMESDIIQRDVRVGIAVNNETNTTEEGMLYGAESIEFNNSLNIKYNFGVLLADNELNQKFVKDGVIFLGGKSRAAILRQEDNQIFKEIKIDKIKNIIKSTGRFKILFLTPAIMSGLPAHSQERDYTAGWKFSEISNDNTMEINETKIKLISAVFNNPLKISGYDMAFKKPKLMYNLLPAGSVYYFEIVSNSGGVKDSNIDDIFNKFYFKNISDKYSKMGFGLTIIGGIE